MDLRRLTFPCGCQIRVWQNGELGLGYLCDSHLKQIESMKPLTEDEQRQAKGVY